MRWRGALSRSDLRGRHRVAGAREDAACVSRVGDGDGAAGDISSEPKAQPLIARERRVPRQCVVFAYNQNAWGGANSRHAKNLRAVIFSTQDGPDQPALKKFSLSMQCEHLAYL